MLVTRISTGHYHLGLSQLMPPEESIFHMYSETPANIVNDTLVEIVFSATTGYSELTWDISVPGNCEYSGLNGNPIPTIFNNGGMTIYGLPVIVTHPSIKPSPKDKILRSMCWPQDQVYHTHGRSARMKEGHGPIFPMEDRFGTSLLRIFIFPMRNLIWAAINFVAKWAGTVCRLFIPIRLF